MYRPTLSLTSVLGGVGGQRHAPAALLPRKVRCPLHRRLGRPQGRSGRSWKISSPPGIDPRTTYFVESRCACTIQLTFLLKCAPLWQSFRTSTVQSECQNMTSKHILTESFQIRNFLPRQILFPSHSALCNNIRSWNAALKLSKKHSES